MSDPLRDRLAAALGPTYELQRLLGKGGMGSVYLARETALDRLVAVKVLPPEVTGDDESRERFRREARTAAKLTHPHIVPLYTFGEADGLLWFVMGYVAGETLAAKLERTPRLDPEIVRRVLADVADALDYAHSHGIVHRDVKPENILIEDAGGKALLADFGVARAGTGGATLTTAGMLVGTPLYMSPEQASGERDLDGRSDIYSLGIVGYRMLAGRTPFEGEELRAVLAAHITQPVPALPEDAPEDLRRAVLRALAKTSVERWGSGREFREAIRTDTGISLDELDRLTGLPGFLPINAIIVLATIVIWLGFRLGRPQVAFWDDPINLIFVLAIAVLPLLPLSVWYNGRRLKLSPAQAFAVAMWPPAWWGLAWPKWWRRPGDVWTRLPMAVRRAREVMTIAMAVNSVSLPTMLLGLIYFAAHPGTIDHFPFAIPILVLAALASTGVLAWAHVTASRFVRQNGLDPSFLSRLLGKPTWNDPFWKKPEIAPLLLPVASKVPAPVEPSTPFELAAKVREVASSLPAHQAGLAREAVANAEAIAGRIVALEGELSALAKDVHEADIEGVEQRLVDLGPARPDEPAGRRAIRAMHEQQLGVLRRLQTQLEEGQGRRDHLAGMLRTLYLQVSELNVETKRLAEADTSGVREIVDRMAREVEGMREVGG